MEVDIFLFLNDLWRNGGIFWKSKALEYFDCKNVFSKAQTFGILNLKNKFDKKILSSRYLTYFPLLNLVTFIFWIITIEKYNMMEVQSFHNETRKISFWYIYEYTNLSIVAFFPKETLLLYLLLWEKNW